MEEKKMDLVDIAGMEEKKMDLVSINEHKLEPKPKIGAPTKLPKDKHLKNGKRNGETFAARPNSLEGEKMVHYGSAAAEKMDNGVTRRRVRHRGLAVPKIKGKARSVLERGEEDDDEAEWQGSPFATSAVMALKRTRRQRQASKVSSTTAAKVAAEDTSDEDVDMSFEKSTANHVADDIEDDEEDLAAEVICLLRDHPDLTEGQHETSMLQMAVENAMQKHPKMKDAQKLVEYAYLVYLEFITT
jgi:hypothetical protein